MTDQTGNDIMSFNYPNKHIYAEALKNNNFPLWNQYIYNGFPVHSEGQVGEFYPINVVLFRILPTWQAYNFLIVLTFFLAGIFTYFYARSIGMTALACVFSGIVYMFSGFFICHLKHLNIISTAMWIPLEVFLVETYFKKQNNIFMLALGVVFGMQILSGSPQMAYYSFIFVFLYFIYRLLLFYKNASYSVNNFVRPFFLLILAYIIGIGLGAIQWIPTYEYAKYSIRNAGLGYEKAVEYGYRFEDLIMFLRPLFFGDPATATYWKQGGLFAENCAYVGIIPLLLAMTGIIIGLKRKSNYILFYLLLLPLLIFAMIPGRFFNLLWLYLPGFNQFRVHQRLLIFFVLGIAVLSGSGLDFMLKNRTKSYYSRFLAYVIILLTIGGLFKFGLRQNPTIDRIEWLKEPATASFLKQDKDSFRILSITSWDSIYKMSKGWTGNLLPYISYRNILEPEFNMLFGLSGIHGCTSFVLERSAKAFNALLQNGSIDNSGLFLSANACKLLGLQNVKYILSLVPIRGPFIEFRQKFNSYPLPDVIIYENKKLLPRILLVPDAKVVPDPNAVLRELYGKNIDPQETLILEENLPGENLHGDIAGSQIKISKYLSDNILIEVNIYRKCFLLVNDTYYPGWKAFVNGIERPILRANYLFRAVRLEPGDKKVEFVYKPKTFILGARISAFTSLGILIYFIIYFLKKNRSIHIRA